VTELQARLYSECVGAGHPDIRRMYHVSEIVAAMGFAWPEDGETDPRKAKSLPGFRLMLSAPPAEPITVNLPNPGPEPIDVVAELDRQDYLPGEDNITGNGAEELPPTEEPIAIRPIPAPGDAVDAEPATAPPAEGTPINLLPDITPAILTALRKAGLDTVEAVEACEDLTALPKIGDAKAVAIRAACMGLRSSQRSREEVAEEKAL
jgi:hypothetical protein